MPPRTIEESHRPRASDRTMHCHSSSGQSYRLVVSENDGRRHNSEMEPQGRTIASPSRTRRQSKTLCLEKTALRVRNYVQTVGLNAETKKDRHRAAGEIFVLTFPLIGPVLRQTRRLASSAAFSSRQLGIQYPHKGTSWLANLLNPSRAHHRAKPILYKAHHRGRVREVRLG
jgi:hypothetical protein